MGEFLFVFWVLQGAIGRERIAENKMGEREVLFENKGEATENSDKGRRGNDLSLKWK